MITIGKRFTFEAAHFIKDHPTCGELHGHSWTLDVMIKAKPTPNGMILDFKVLGGIVRDILKKYDHQVINDQCQFEPVTAETLVEVIARRIRQHLYEVIALENYTLGCRLQEGIDGGWAEWWEGEWYEDSYL